MPFRQQVVAIVISVSVLFLIIALVRARRLREEYAFLWLVTGATLLVLALRFSLLQQLTRLIGVVLPVSTLFFFALIFLMLVSLQFSVKISALTNQVQELAQRLALYGVQEPSGREQHGLGTSRSKSRDDTEGRSSP